MTVRLIVDTVENISLILKNVCLTCHIFCICPYLTHSIKASKVGYPEINWKNIINLAGSKVISQNKKDKDNDLLEMSPLWEK